MYAGSVGQGNGGKDRVAVRDVGIVSRIFGHSARAIGVSNDTSADGKCDRFAIGQGDRGGVLYFLREKSQQCRSGGCSST